MKVFQPNTELLWGSCRDVMAMPAGVARPACMDRLVRFARYSHSGPSTFFLPWMNLMDKQAGF